MHQLSDIIQMSVDIDDDRLEVANVQYYGWELKNRAALMPTLEHIEDTSRIVDFFFQAEDGIRDHCVTGVQTCAIPISGRSGAGRARPRRSGFERAPGSSRR